MKIKNLLKKVTLPLLLAGALSGCGPEGVPIKGDYPLLTQERKERLEELATECQENNCQIVLKNPKVIMATEDGRTAIDFQGYPKEIINRIYGFMDRIIKLDSNIDILPQSKIAIDCDAKGTDSEEGCYKPLTDTIKLSDKFNFSTFTSKLFHELGHPKDIWKKEYFSVALELSTPIYAYMFSPKIGSPILNNVFNDYLLDSNVPKNYKKAVVYFSKILQKNNGNLEKTLEKISKENIEDISQEVINNPIKENYQAWSYILNNSMLKKKISQYVSENESNEMVDYLNILNLEKGRFGDISLQEEYYQQMLNFREKEKYTNQFFKEQIEKRLKNYLDRND